MSGAGRGGFSSGDTRPDCDFLKNKSEYFGDNFFRASPPASCQSFPQLSLCDVSHHFGLRVLLLLLVIFQYVAMTWYTLSYVPYGQSATKKCLKKCFLW